MKLKDIFKQLLRYAAVYAGLIILFAGLMIGSAALPKTARLEKNMKQSAKILMQNGDWPKFGGILLDNYTDSLILHAGWTFDPAHPVRSALDPAYYYTEEEAGMSGAPNLSAALSGKLPEMKRYSYWRYWFGHSATMKLLHYFTSLRKIYAGCGFITLVLFFLCFLRILQRDGKLPAFALFILLSLCNFHVFFLSLQYYPVIWIGLIGFLVLDRCDRMEWRGPVFFALGMVTAYFDLLTAPVLGFGIPALFICCRETAEAERSGTSGWLSWFRTWCGYPAVWMAGYVMSWGTKILLGLLSGGRWSEIARQINVRSGNMLSDRTVSALKALQRNLNTLTDNSALAFWLCAAVFVIVLITCLIAWKRGRMTFCLGIVPGCLLLAVMPVVTILVMVNHTYIHSYMTYRGLTLSCAALVMALTAFRPSGERSSVPDRS